MAIFINIVCSDFFFYSNSGENAISNNSVLRFYFKNMANVHLSKNRVAQRESC